MRNDMEYRKKIERFKNTPAGELESICTPDEKVEAMTSEEFSNYIPEISGEYDEYMLLARLQNGKIDVIKTSLDKEEIIDLYNKKCEDKTEKIPSEFKEVYSVIAPYLNQDCTFEVHRGIVRYAEIFGCPIMFNYDLEEKLL